MAGSLVAGGSWWKFGNEKRDADRYSPVARFDAPDVAGLKERKVIRVLSVNGGGVRGVVPAQVLSYLEKKSGRPIAELFDLFAGTSIGATVVAGSLVPDENKAPLHTCAAVARHIDEATQQLFKPNYRRNFLSLGGILSPKFKCSEKRELFAEFLGPATFGSLLKPTVFTAYDLINERPVALKNWTIEFGGYETSDLLTAVTTIPGLFAPVELCEPGGTKLVLLDVGLFENSPAYAALQIARELAPDADILIVDVGTGLASPDVAFNKINRWGALKWTPDFMPLLSRANASVFRDLIDHEQRYGKGPRIRYIPIDVEMRKGEYIGPFDASNESQIAISELAQKCIRENKKQLDELAAELAAPEILQRRGPN